MDILVLLDINGQKLAGGCTLLLNADIFEKILFLIILSSSIYNLIFTVSMNKTSSLFKVQALSFFAPALLSTAAFLYPANAEADKVISLCEVSLLAEAIFLSVYPYNTGNHKTIAVGIIVFSVLLTGYSMTAEEFVYYSLPGNTRITINAVLIIILLTYIKTKRSDQKIMAPLSIMLVGILMGYFRSRAQLSGIILIVKGCAYIAFTYYFYIVTYNSYISKISESENIIRNMEHSLNKEVKKRVFEIEKSNERLLEMSKTDMLTKAFNKITILNIIERLISNKKIEVFSIIMFDIDNFKVINDSLGHVTGDLCLKTLANIASGNIREVDYLGRYGGDEFIIVLPTLGFSEARFVAERFKKKVNETSNPRFTVSIGISTYPDDGQTVNELISVADRGLYKSKSRGKNSISHANTL